MAKHRRFSDKTNSDFDEKEEKIELIQEGNSTTKIQWILNQFFYQVPNMFTL